MRAILGRSNFVARSLTVALATLALLSGAGVAGGRDRSHDAARRPNILLIVTDDQRIGTLNVMPVTKRKFADQGTVFRDAYATSPLCCPSRTSIMTGQYPHNHEVRRNEDSQNLDQDSTVQHYLQQAGYLTGLAGKYLNGWPELEAAPPDFDRWAAIDDSSYAHVYTGFGANVDGRVFYPSGYSTDFIGDQTVRFLRGFESDDDRPWFLYVAPFASHKPFEPERIYRRARTPQWNGNPAVGELDRSDKPPWVQQRNVGLSGARGVSRSQSRTLMSVDDLVEKTFAALNRFEEGRDTLAIFISDNGYLWGEHGLASKRFPYTEAVKVPLAIRWPGHMGRGKVDDRMVANIDIAPSLLDVVGIEVNPEIPMDGRSIFAPGGREALLLEYFGANTGESPPWASYRTHEYQYIEYYDETTGVLTFNEYYDLVNDRWQLENLLGDQDAGNDPLTPLFSAQLAEAKNCAGSSCP
jgi:arylsulfatase A-like enzyme